MNKQFGSWPLVCLALVAILFAGTACKKKQVIKVIGGYAWMANFIDQKGYVATDGVYGVNTQYNFANTDLNEQAAWTVHEAVNPDPVAFDCGVCHATGYTAEGEEPAEGYAGSDTCKACHTGAMVLSFAESGHQHALTTVAGEMPQMPFTEIAGAPENFKIGSTVDFDFEKLAGIEGQWVEPNIGCEACHGPSKAHVNASADLSKRPDLEVARQSCSKCHVSGAIDNGVVALDGDIETDGNFVNRAQEWEEWLASPHSPPDNASDPSIYPGCATCHNPHASTKFDAEAEGAGRTVYANDDCLACHAGMTIDIAEMAAVNIMCIDCHMPYAGKAAFGLRIIGAEGDYAHVGDIRSHQFKIKTSGQKNSIIDEITTKVKLDANAKTLGLTIDYVCKPCHSANGFQPRDLPAATPLATTVLQTEAAKIHTNK